jgi:glycosyltransferase involved in cell wall biosynthesis
MVLTNTTQPVQVSVIITNYNYATYLRDSIESVLRQDYDRIELIIVDDGSSDFSRDILAEYRNEAAIIFKENGGQTSAFNLAYRRCRGDLVMTLDSDDTLDEDAISRVAEAWTPGVAEVHFALRLINEDGSTHGGQNPSARLASGDLATVLRERGRYIGPPSSGNVYSRTALNSIMPIPEADWRHSDCYLETLVPFYGRVVALDRPAGSYRLHFGSASGVAGLDRRKIDMLIRHDHEQDALLTKFCSRKGIPFQPGVGLSHWGHLKLLLSRDRAVSSPEILATCLQFVRALWRSKGELGAVAKFCLTAWALAVTLLPGKAGRVAAQFAFSRPRLFTVEFQSK